MGETIAKNKKAYHDMLRQEIVPKGTILVDAVTIREEVLLGYKIASMENMTEAKDIIYG